MQRRDRASGFSLIEIMAALVVFSLMSITIVGVYGRLFANMQGSVLASHGVFFMRNVMYQAQKEEKIESFKEEHDDMPIIASYELAKPTPKSSFAGVPRLQVARVAGSWEVLGRPVQPVLFSLVYEPPQEEEGV